MLKDGLIRTGNDAFAQLTQKHQAKPTTFRTRIQRVIYANRKLKVAGRGYSGPRRVTVQVGIDLGTSDRPKVFINDMAIIEHTAEGKWICTSIRAKQHCAVNPDGSEVEIEIEQDGVSSYTTQSFGAGITPLDLFLPPLEPLGQLTPPSQRFPNPTQYLCGIPQCTDCAPDGYSEGMTLLLSSDDTYPGGCWKWGFRQGGRIYYRATVLLWEQGVDENVRDSSSVVVIGLYAYVIEAAPEFDSLPTRNSNLYTIDLTDIDAPVVVDTLDVGYGFSSTWIGGHGNAIYVEGTSFDGTTAQLQRYDISTPASPSQTDDVSSPVTFTSALYTDSMGDNYIVGNGFGASELRVVDDSLTVVGTLSMASFGQPIFVGDTALVQVFSAFPDDLFAIDLTDPTTPTTLWDDNMDGTIDSGALSDTQGYFGHYIYDLTVPAVISKTSIDPPFPEALHPVVVTDRMYGQNGGSPTGASAYNISSPAIPVLVNSVGGPVVLAPSFGTVQQSDGDTESNPPDPDVLRFATTGAHFDTESEPVGLYFVLFSNYSPGTP